MIMYSKIAGKKGTMVETTETMEMMTGMMMETTTGMMMMVTMMETMMERVRMDSETMMGMETTTTTTVVAVALPL